MTIDPTVVNFVYEFNRLAGEISAQCKAKGFADNWNDGEKLALIHAEISEALEELRKVNHEPSEKLNGAVTKFTEELADAIIRIMDFAGHYNLDLGSAIVLKHAYNGTRPHKHGKKF